MHKYSKRKNKKNKKFLKNPEKTLDKPNGMCYNKYRKREGKRPSK
jgi:hypothetical protein